MPSVIENVQKKGDDLLVQVEAFLREHSSLTLRPFNNDVYRRVYGRAGDYLWNILQGTGMQEQAKLLPRCDHFFSILGTLLSGQTVRCRGEVERARKRFRSLITQENRCGPKSIDVAVEVAEKAMQTALGSLSRLYDPKGAEVCYVPDTNALLYNTQLDAWQFDGVPTFTVLLTPTVLSELDDLKVRGNDKVQPKAEKLVRQIKEYTRRGNLSEGVTLSQGRSVVRSLAVEPDMDHTLPWLDRSNKDDRLIASFLEVMRHHPCSEVILVSRDVNIHNKANFALLSVIDPPDPAAQQGS